MENIGSGKKYFQLSLTEFWKCEFVWRLPFLEFYFTFQKKEHNIWHVGIPEDVFSNGFNSFHLVCESLMWQ